MSFVACCGVGFCRNGGGIKTTGPGKMGRADEGDGKATDAVGKEDEIYVTTVKEHVKYPKPQRSQDIY